MVCVFGTFEKRVFAVASYFPNSILVPEGAADLG